MNTVYLFDWGDTLMVDFPDRDGKMCEWEEVAAVDGAREVLHILSASAAIYVVTGAAQSDVVDIECAFRRVALDRFITGYFCRANTGAAKGMGAFLPKILAMLGRRPDEVTAVGDSWKKDIEPALAVGMPAIWLTPSGETNAPNVRVIRSLSELRV